MSNLKTMKINEKVYTKLRKLKAKMEQEQGKRVTFDKVLERLMKRFKKD